MRACGEPSKRVWKCSMKGLLTCMESWATSAASAARRWRAASSCASTLPASPATLPASAAAAAAALLAARALLIAPSELEYSSVGDAGAAPGVGGAGGAGAASGAGAAGIVVAGAASASYGIKPAAMTVAPSIVRVFTVSPRAKHSRRVRRQRLGIAHLRQGIDQPTSLLLERSETRGLHVPEVRGGEQVIDLSNAILQAAHGYSRSESHDDRF